jgi:hypothetical protein
MEEILALRQKAARGHAVFITPGGTVGYIVPRKDLSMKGLL